MADKDVLYHEVLEAFQAGGCALCRLGRRAADSYLHALIYEGVTDPGLRQQLRDARGPCHRHAWRMANRRGSVLGTAIMYRDFVNTLTKVLEAGEDVRRGGRFSAAAGNPTWMPVWRPPPPARPAPWKSMRRTAPPRSS